jgi:hypothetical protein
LSVHLPAEQVAADLKALFQRYGAPLFLKRDNDSKARPTAPFKAGENGWMQALLLLVAQPPPYRCPRLSASPPSNASPNNRRWQRSAVVSAHRRHGRWKPLAVSIQILSMSRSVINARYAGS